MHKRWDFAQMLDASQKLFTKIYKRKYLAHHNHEIHFLARELNEWLPKGIQSLMDGNYWPRHLRRLYFKDDVVDQLHLSDRIFQHVLLKQLKTTFRYTINPNCYHMNGPTGVKWATKRIQEALQSQQFKFVIRADIKSFYASIPHYKLIKDIKQIYDDPKLQAMLIRVIENPIETARGYKNPGMGIALRGPLSQFFSGIYLKPLDDVFNKMDVAYVRYNDDLIVLCKTKHQMNRCKRRMMEVLYERKLTLSRKKSRIGCIEKGFHFLGIHYLGTRPQDHTKAARLMDDLPQCRTEVDTVRGGGTS